MSAPVPITPVDLSLLIAEHMPVEIPPCRVCGHEMKMTGSDRSGAATYRCSSDAAQFLGKDGQARRDAEDHYQHSFHQVGYHGDSQVCMALFELRRLREAAGEDMTVPVGTVAFPSGHGRHLCYRSLVHQGDDRWKQHIDRDFTHCGLHADADRFLVAGDPEPVVGFRIIFGGRVWVRHPQHRWIAEFAWDSGALGIDWERLLEAATPVGVTVAEPPLRPEYADRGD